MRTGLSGDTVPESKALHLNMDKATAKGQLLSSRLGTTFMFLVDVGISHPSIKLKPLDSKLNFLALAPDNPIT